MKTTREEIMVSIICMCYNHGKYISDALESFVNQKTNFKYEVIIHDDASTDNSAEIIKEYEKKYPDIIKPIYQSENQHSQGIKIVKTFMLPKLSGKYIAFCEGDDYWTDENKLQKQVDFLENNPEFSVCVHNTEVENMGKNKTEIKLSPNDKAMKLKDVLKESERYHTSSLIVCREFYINRPSWVNSVYGIGDLPSAIYYAASGRIMYFGDVMSHYRYGVPGSWSHKHSHNVKNQIKNNKNIIKMLKEANKYYEHKHFCDFVKSIFGYRLSIFKSYVKLCFPVLMKLKKPF